MNRYALIESSVVTNVILWDGNTEMWQPPEGTTAVEVTADAGPAYIGGTYVDGHFTLPPDSTE
ncbi:hypothetical protein VOI32_15600 [Paraburkholderia caribensis]|uniref:Uncharacterized protein n=1 Tax=Paraburkholderia caribensis TaxID=75105 RepID=A0A9Q6WL52_9BURK|nr:hypothetical protein [Paraburkholderia caribensis]MCO4875783.1 hypothetical protein [Paraburkholderia caribensis]PTB29697.1 hypothetical protein C9I56_07010 [Paraburkholderia caribensis]QLB62582.1 hypothetical protein A9O66_09430 [Paraburkholderia caribensis]